MALFLGANYLVLKIKTTKMNRNFFIMLLSFSIFIACTSNSGNKETKSATPVSKPNDEMRQVYLSNLKTTKDTLQILNQMLDKLDANNLALGAFIKKNFYTIEDSCEAANKNIIDSLKQIDQNLPNTFIDSVRNKTTKAYQDQLKISREELDLMEYVTFPNTVIVKYLNKKYNLQLFTNE